MSPEQAAAAAKADYTQNGASYNLGSTPTLGIAPTTYSYLPNGSGGYNFYKNGSTPITREEYASGSGNPYPGGTGGGNTGGGDTLGASTTASNPWSTSSFGSQANYDAQHQGITDTANSAADVYNAKAQSGILDFLSQLKTGQGAINNQGAEAELSKMNASTGIMGMVDRGIKSGSTMLANRNASNSSAAEAIAKAYGDLGNRNMADANNQYATDQRGIQQQQDQLDAATAQFNRHSGEDKNMAVNAIAEQARQSLAQLDALLKGASLPDAINIENEKNSIKNAALAKLQGLDTQLSAGEADAANRPNDLSARQSTASGWAAAGRGAEQPFQFTSQAPMSFAGGAPAGASMPLFTLPRKRQG